VRFAPGSATQTNDSGVLVFGHLQFGTRTNYSQDYFGGSSYGMDVPATNTGWVHVSIPLSVADDPNLAAIHDLLIHIYGPTYTPVLTGPSTLWVDNIAFVGPTNCYIVDQFNPAGTGGYSYTNGQMASVWANWFGGAWVTNCWDATNDATGLAANNKVYDGTTIATVSLYDTMLNASLSGVLSGDFNSVFLSTNGCTAGFTTRNAGSGIAVTAGGLTLSGSAGSNYSVVSLALTADVAPLAVTVTATADSKNYDGTTAAAHVPAVSPAPATGDTENVSESYDTANVGTGKHITPTGTINDGNGGANYNYTYEAATNGTIVAAPLTITADDKKRTQGLPNPSFTVTCTGFVNNEDTHVLSTPPALVTSATTNSPAGAYPITVAGAFATNYDISYVNGTLTVEAQPRLEESGSAGSGLVLAFPTLAGQLYQMEYKTNLADSAWIPWGNSITGTGGSLSVTNTLTAPQSYFRLNIQQP
jgi:hypothetical protein